MVAPPGLLLHLLGVFGPRAVPLLWWLARAAVAVGPAAAGATATGITGQDPLVPGITVAALLALAAPALVASLAEEPGWRGAALDLWQTQARPVVAATGIGMLWSVWHLPLSFVEGTYVHELGLGSARFRLTHLMLVLLGILLVWLVNGSGGSILLAVLAHTGFNTAIGLTAATRPPSSRSQPQPAPPSRSRRDAWVSHNPTPPPPPLPQRRWIRARARAGPDRAER